MTFKDQQFNSMTFKASKMKFLNFMFFQVFCDLYEPRKTAELRDQLNKRVSFFGNMVYL